MKEAEQMSKTVISEKSKKSDILEAYNKVLKEVNSKQFIAPQEEKIKKDEKEIVEKTARFTFEEITQSLSKLKMKVSKNLDELQENLILEHQKFVQLQKAVQLSKKEMEDLHEISVSTNTLTALIQTQKEVKENSETEIEEKRGEAEKDIAAQEAQWKEKKTLFEKENKESKEILELAREREQEKYQYNLEMKRKKELHDNEEEKQALHKELEELKLSQEQAFQEREKILQDREIKLDFLSQQVENFPAELEEALEQTRIQVKKEMEAQHHFEVELTKQEQAGDQRLYQQQIGSLNAKIKEQEAHIEKFSKQVNESGQQVREIAIKAVEGASQLRSLDRAAPRMDSAKN